MNKNPEPALQEKDSTESIVLGGGCFWCLEAIYQKVPGIISVESGYAGGHKPNPTYEEVCTGNTGHAEVVKVVFNPSVITLEEILKIFFTMHDPTSLNRQGNDVGTQYRSAIFYTHEHQKKTIEKILQLLKDENIYDKSIVTEVKPLNTFYKAELYHQNYYVRNSSQPYCRYVILPKIEKFEKIFQKLLQQKK